MDYTFEKSGNVGIFSFNSDITSKHEDNLKLLLMRAIHSIDRAVLNFKKVKKIDSKCLKLIRTAYCASIRLKNPLIITNIPQMYYSMIYNCAVGHNTNSAHC